MLLFCFLSFGREPVLTPFCWSEASEVYKRPLHGGAERVAMRAAIAVAYGLSLRPGEYLAQTDGTPLEKQMNASDCFFVFDED